MAEYFEAVALFAPLADFEVVIVEIVEERGGVEVGTTVSVELHFYPLFQVAFVEPFLQSLACARGRWRWSII